MPVKAVNCGFCPSDNKCTQNSVAINKFTESITESQNFSLVTKMKTPTHKEIVVICDRFTHQNESKRKKKIFLVSSVETDVGLTPSISWPCSPEAWWARLLM